MVAGAPRGHARFRAAAAETNNLTCSSNLHDLEGTLKTKNFEGNHKHPDKAKGHVSMQESCDYKGGVIRDDKPKGNSNDIHFKASLSFSFEISGPNGQTTKVMTVPLKAKPNPPADKVINYVGLGETKDLKAEFESNGAQISAEIKNIIEQLEVGQTGVSITPKQFWTQVSGIIAGTSGCTESGTEGACDTDVITLNLYLEPDADGDGKVVGDVNN